MVRLWSERSPRFRRWFRRMVLIFFCQMIFSQTPTLLIASQFWLMGRWGMPQRLVRRILKLRIKKRPNRARI